MRFQFRELWCVGLLYECFCFSLIGRVPSGYVKARGTIYLSNIRMVFVANQPVGNFVAFDMPLVSDEISFWHVQKTPICLIFFIFRMEVPVKQLSLQ